MVFMQMDDIIVCKYSQKFFLPSLDYALKSWTSTFNRMGKPNPYSRVEKILIGLIAEFAVENYLKDLNIKINITGKTKWYEEDRYDLGIGGYAIDVKGSFIDLNSQYHSSIFNNMFFNEFEWYTNCHALVPLDQFNPGNNPKRKHKKEKIYIFPFIKGNFNKNVLEGTLIHTFWDYRWLKRAEFKNLPSLSNLDISYNGKLGSSSIILYGTTKEKEICVEKINLDRNNIVTRNQYFQIFSILWDGVQPSGTLEIRSDALKLYEQINPSANFDLQKNINGNGYYPKVNDWQNLDINNCEIILLGWIDEAKLRIIGRKYPRFCKDITQYSEIKVDNWGCQISDLNSMSSIKNIYGGG